MNQYFVLEDFFSLYLIAAGIPEMGYPYPVFPNLARPPRLARVRSKGSLLDNILHIHNSAFAVPEPIADYVPGLLQLLQG